MPDVKGRTRVIDPAEIVQMVREYEQGASVRQVAASTGRGYGTVHRFVREAGIMRTRAAGSKARGRTR